MINRVTDSNFSWLISHLVEIEEKWESMIDEFYPDTMANNDRREDLRDIFRRYIDTLDGYLQSGKAADLNPQDLPIVLIGSEVEALELKEQTVYNYRVVLPSQYVANCVSCLSPMGRALLLRSKGDTVTVRAPGGDFQYKINRISF